ncbi:hypothetical protein Syun_007381 [Stephania yunnanensis]|uniref:Uncharacterized protein n=1 Tax=Stephania yunnanensis TaxID=152371 RepID=A0AAP0L0Z7_9MAGN
MANEKWIHVEPYKLYHVQQYMVFLSQRVSRLCRSDTYVDLSVLTNRKERWILGVA